MKTYRNTGTAVKAVVSFRLPHSSRLCSFPDLRPWWYSAMQWWSQDQLGDVRTSRLPNIYFFFKAFFPVTGLRAQVHSIVGGFLACQELYEEILCKYPQVLHEFLEVSFLDEVQTSLKLQNLGDLPKNNLRGLFRFCQKVGRLWVFSKLE